MSAWSCSSYLHFMPMKRAVRRQCSSYRWSALGQDGRRHLVHVWVAKIRSHAFRVGGHACNLSATIWSIISMHVLPPCSPETKSWYVLILASRSEASPASPGHKESGDAGCSLAALSTASTSGSVESIPPPGSVRCCRCCCGLATAWRRAF